MATSVKIDTAACKQAIVDYVAKNPGHVQAQFVDQIDEKLALNVRNWKRELKTGKAAYGPAGAKWMREFACKSYGDGDELRAYVWDDETTILRVEVQGE